MSVSSHSSVDTTASALVFLRDETLDITQLSAYNLYATVGTAGIRIGVADVRRNKFVALEEYARTQDSTPGEQLLALAAQHDLLGQTGWQQVRLAVHNRAFTLLPATLFTPGDEAAYLRLHHAATTPETVHAYRHASIDAVNIFALDQAIGHWFTSRYPSGRLLHQTSALLEGVLHQSEAHAPRRTYLSITPQELTVVVMRNKRPEFCNVFAFTTPEDLIYYTILVMQELQLNPDQDAVVVWGDLLHNSELFSVLRKYIRHLRFGNRPFDLAYSYRLNDLFEYRYFDLYALHLCE